MSLECSLICIRAKCWNILLECLNDSTLVNIYILDLLDVRVYVSVIVEKLLKDIIYSEEHRLRLLDHQVFSAVWQRRFACHFVLCIVSIERIFRMLEAVTEQNRLCLQKSHDVISLSFPSSYHIHVKLVVDYRWKLSFSRLH